MKRYFNKELKMTKDDEEDFETSIKCQICDNAYVDGGVKARDPCHITEQYWSSAHRYCNINIKLNHIISVVFHNLRNYGSHLTLQELAK